MAKMQLEIWDYITLSALVILSSIIGLYHVFKSRTSKSTKDFLVASKDLGLFPLILSTMATFFSAIGMLGFPVEVYMNGLIFSFIIIPKLMHIPIAIFLYLPLFYKLNKNTIFEYLELRFSKTIRTFTSLLLFFHLMLFTAVVIYAPALAISQVTGLHLWASVTSIGFICVIYTSMGGLKAVVWADVTQSLVMIAVLLTVVIKGLTHVGGIHVAWDLLQKGNRTIISDSGSQSQYTIWTFVLANPTCLIGITTLNQQFMQRYLSNSSLKRAQLCYIGGQMAIGLAQILVILTGVAMYAHYHDCDPLLSGQIKVRDQQMALFAMESLSFFKGLSGVFVAGVMCATLSTLSSTLNALTAVTISDYIKPMKPHISDVALMKLSKVLVVVYGVVCITLVALAENIGGIVQETFGIGGIASGPVVTIFTLGMLFPWVNSKGATVGFMCAIVLPLWAWIGKLLTKAGANLHAPLNVDGCIDVNVTFTNYTFTPILNETGLHQFYSHHAFWYTNWSLGVGIVTALLYTFITGAQDPKKVDQDLLFFFMKKYGGKQSHHNNDNKADDIRDHVEEPLMLLRN
ncbi:hypothetical protein CHUAL_006699 [Chamberlinius hualienensis]